MAMGTNKLKLVRMRLDSIKKPLQLFISNTKLGVFITSCNVRMYLNKYYTHPPNPRMITDITGIVSRNSKDKMAKLGHFIYAFQLLLNVQ